MNILLGITGSVAAKLTPKLQQAIIDAGHVLKTVCTKSASNFIPESPNFIYNDDDAEWRYYHDYNTVLHIDLVKWADKFLIAPCTANTLSKIECGICDNLLTSCVRAWPKDKSHIILAPAMNTEMWDKDHIKRQYEKLVINGCYSWIAPIEKTLFCGDIGMGAMASIDDIVNRLED